MPAGQVDPSRLVPDGTGFYVLPQSNPGHAPRYDLGEGARYNADGTIHYDPNGIWNTKLGKVGILATLAGAGGAGGALASGAFGGGAAAGGAASSAMPATTAGISGSVLPGAAVAAPTVAGGVAAGGAGVGTAGILGTLEKLSKYYQMAGDVGSVLGKQQAGAAAGKIQQTDLNQRQDQNALARYVTEQNAQNTAANTDLQRKQFETNNRGATARQALIGMLLGGGTYQPTKVGPGGASGGLLNSLNANPEALAALKTLGTQAGTAQNTPLQFQGGNVLTPPPLTSVPKIDDGGWLSTLARIGELAGAASPYVKPKTPSMPGYEG